MGKTYLLEHCIYQYNAKQERLAYEIYVTDRLKNINECVANTFGGSAAKDRYIDILERFKNPEPEDERTAEEIITTIAAKLEAIGNESI